MEIKFGHNFVYFSHLVYKCLCRASNRFYMNFQKYKKIEITHFNAKMTDINIWVPFNLSHTNSYIFLE